MGTASSVRTAGRKLAPHTLTKRVLEALPEGRAIAEEVWQRRHKGMLVLLWLHVPAIVAYSVVRGKGLPHGLFEGAIPAFLGAISIWAARTRRTKAVAATLGLTSCSAILVHLSGGLIELHFHFFFTLAAVSLYHDWAPFLTAVGFVAVQHGLMGAINPTAVYNHPQAIAHPWRWAGIHASFVLATSAVSLIRWKSSEVEALKDPLTWLPNRALFGDRLRQALARSAADQGKVAVMFLDVDDFKGINDTAGHAAGDRLLIVVADRLRAAVRPADTVARLGGDEFAIVLEDIKDPETANEVATRILKALVAPLTFEDRQLAVTGSIGIALQIDADTTESELVRNADIAMYVAKKSGKGRYAVFEPSMHEAVMERSQLAGELELALDHQQLQLLYQPIVNMTSQDILGFEALLRWEHPRLGFLSPARFIALAEETGLIIPMGRWILATACAQIKAWENYGPRWMSVNVSARQLADPDFVDDVAMCVRGADIEPRNLILEITETSMVGEDEKMVETLHQLRDLGVRIAIDDFGTGYSSLGYLRRLPVDILKIDKTFIDGTDRGPEDASLAKAIIRIAESMGILCVAEGVERPGQAATLRAAGCEIGQGYYFGRPSEAERTEALLEWQPKQAHARGTILVASSDLPTRGHIVFKLRTAGFDILEAATGKQAIDVMLRQHVDLLVVDVPLADMHAVELGTRLKNEDATAGVPILALGQPENSTVIRLADAHVAKPVRDHELIEGIRALLSVPA